MFKISTFLIRRKRSKLRQLMRGYARMVRKGEIGRLRRVETLMVDQKVNCDSGWFEQVLFGMNQRTLEIAVRQFLLQRYAGPSLRKALLYAIGGEKDSAICPIPPFWQDILISNGFPINRFGSNAAWYLAVIGRYLQGAFSIVNLLIQGLLKRALPLAGRHVHFLGLNPRNIPSSPKGGLGYDICSWYLSWAGRDKAAETVCHDVQKNSGATLGSLKICYSPEPCADLRSFRQIRRFAIWGVISMMLSFVGILRGRWWGALMLSEAAKAKVIEFGEREWLASDYLFHFSRSIYRPLWTYAAEKRGSRIICYFYSTYAQPRLTDIDEGQRFEWGPATWPLYLVWDAYQADILRRDLGASVELDVVGAVHFSDPIPENPKVPPNSIAVFDIQPQRRSFVLGISTLYEYLSAHPSAPLKFLEDIYAVISQCQMNMVLKAKRYIAADGHKGYVAFTRRLSANENVMIAPPELAAPRLMKQCVGAISAPFTSTALYFREQGYPSIYYDPLGVLDRNDPAAHGIPVISGREELFRWMATIVVKVT